MKLRPVVLMAEDKPCARTVISIQVGVSVLKGFPNQMASPAKLGRALSVAREVQSQGGRVRDDGTYGEALIRAGVLGTGHTPRPIEEYLADQRLKPNSQQSYRTSARGLREFFKLLSCFSQTNEANDVRITALGLRLARETLEPLTDTEQIEWRIALRALRIGDSERGHSHPYTVLLRLAYLHPNGMPRSHCALCLEADDDSDTELQRIFELSQITDELEIWERIGGDRQQPANWKNAIKVLPTIAEHLGDIRKQQQIVFSITNGDPGEQSGLPADIELTTGPIRTNGRAVTSATIAVAGTSADALDRISVTRTPTSKEIAATLTARAERLTRHNLIVQRLAKALEAMGASLQEDPYDCLASTENETVLFEIKTIDHQGSDERERVRAALAQLLYYASFSLDTTDDGPPVALVALFDRKLSEEHQAWFTKHGICCAWTVEENHYVVSNTDSTLVKQLSELNGTQPGGCD